MKRNARFSLSRPKFDSCSLCTCVLLLFACRSRGTFDREDRGFLQSKRLSRLGRVAACYCAYSYIAVQGSPRCPNQSPQRPQDSGTCTTKKHRAGLVFFCKTLREQHVLPSEPKTHNTSSGLSDILGEQARGFASCAKWSSWSNS